MNKIWSDRKIKIANAIEKIYTHYIQLNRSCKCIFDNELLKDCNRKLLLVHIYTYTCKYLMKNEVNYIVSCTLLTVSLSVSKKKYHSAHPNCFLKITSFILELRLWKWFDVKKENKTSEFTFFRKTLIVQSSNNRLILFIEFQIMVARMKNLQFNQGIILLTILSTCIE